MQPHCFSPREMFGPRFVGKDRGAPESWVFRACTGFLRTSTWDGWLPD